MSEDELRDKLIGLLGENQVTTFTDTDGERSMRLTRPDEQVDALMPVVIEALADCHDAAVELTLDHAIRNDDGITLRLDKPNPWRVSD